MMMLMEHSVECLSGLGSPCAKGSLMCLSAAMFFFLFFFFPAASGVVCSPASIALALNTRPPSKRFGPYGGNEGSGFPYLLRCVKPVEQGPKPPSAIFSRWCQYLDS